MKILNKGTEDDRRKKIINASKSKDKRYLPQLIGLLESDETYENKRHIIRAIGNIGELRVVDMLNELIILEKGLILGDIAEALGKLKHESSKEVLLTLQNHKLAWVSEKARWALQQI